MTIAPSTLARLLRVCLAELEEIEREQATQKIDWLSQAGSPIGPRKHCALVRNLVAEGKPGAAIVGRRYLLSPAALRDAMEARASVATASRPKTPSDPVENLRDKLKLIGGDL